MLCPWLWTAVSLWIFLKSEEFETRALALAQVKIVKLLRECSSWSNEVPSRSVFTRVAIRDELLDWTLV